MNKSSRRSAWSALLGNLFEHYDTALFSFLSPFLAPLFFPKDDPITALILTYAMIPLAMVARPLGSLLFGYIGDRYGRREALFLSLGGMGVISLGIAMSPTYAMIGVAAPILFCFWRFIQNFLAAGEIMGGAILLLENADQKSHDLASSLYNASTVGGMLLASFGVSLLSGNWRLLYVLGSIVGLFGLFLRLRMPKEKLTKTSLPLSLWKHKKPLAILVLVAGCGYVNFTIALVLMNGFIPLVTSFTKVQMSSLNTALLAFDFLLLPLFGLLAGRTSRKWVMVGATVGILLFGIPLLSLLPSCNLAGIIAIRTLFVLFGMAFFAPFHAFASELVPQENRYSLISLSYAIGTQALGGPTAALSLWMYKKTGAIWSIGWYWVVIAAATTVVLLSQKGREKKILELV